MSSTVFSCIYRFPKSNDDTNSNGQGLSATSLRFSLPGAVRSTGTQHEQQLALHKALGVGFHEPAAYARISCTNNPSHLLIPCNKTTEQHHVCVSQACFPSACKTPLSTLACFHSGKIGRVQDESIRLHKLCSFFQTCSQPIARAASSEPGKKCTLRTAEGLQTVDHREVFF